MKKITLFLCILSSTVFSQKKDAVIFKIDETNVLVSEFKRVYEKNLDVLVDDSQKDIENYLDLYIAYKLKLKEGYRLKLDTTKTYKREIETYRNQLISPYLQDSAYLSKLVKDAYFRTKYQVKASHILVRLASNASPKDTLAAYGKIMNARKEILSGKPFSEVALKVSEDESVKVNKGDLGYFRAFKMLYPFENAVFNTKVGEVSKPFKTRYGYHIAKVYDLKLSKGDVEVAHILITDKRAIGKKRIDSIYTSLLKGSDFAELAKQFSNDNSTIQKGGKLPKFGVGRMLSSFENVAFSLKNENELSAPFETTHGWHIIKLLKKYPVKSFSELKNELTEKVKSSGRARLSDLAVLNRLKKEYTILIHKKNKEMFDRKSIRGAKRDTLQKTLLTINKKEISQVKFFDYLRNRRHKKVEILFDDFLNEEVLTYFKENLVHTEPEYARTLKEYEEGLLLFELMEQKVWKKSTNDDVGLQKYFSKNRSNYSFKELSANKGQVMNDYQLYIEKEWLKELKTKYAVTIDKKVVKRLIKSYRK